MNNDLVVLSYPGNKVYVNCATVLFDADKELVDTLENISITGED